MHTEVMLYWISGGTGGESEGEGSRGTGAL